MSEERRPIRCLLIGDIHISDRHIDITTEALANTLKLAAKRKDQVDFFCIMGDIFDTHRVLMMDHRNKAIDFIEALSEIKPTVILIGNHDRIHNRDFMSDVHPFYGMKDIKGKLYFVSRPKVLRFQKKYSVLFMPYVAPGRFLEGINGYLDAMHAKGQLEDVKDVRDLALICAHQEFYGAPYGPTTSVNGDKWPEDYPMVISGHIHGRILLQKNILYTGSLYPATYAESHDKGALTVSYDPETRHLDYTATRVVMSRKKVERIAATDEDKVREMICLENKHTKFIVSGKADEIAAVRAKVQQEGRKINWVPDVRIPEKTLSSGSFDERIRQRVEGTSLASLFSELLSH